ncbi:MAG: hypothetical protein ACKVP6_12220 [Mycobacterium sp.]
MSGRRLPVTALSLAGLVALCPVMITSPATVTAQPVPARPTIAAVHIDDIQLAGIGQDIYYAITPTVQYVVGGGSYLVNFVPIVGGVIAAQININYFQGIQPVVEATVNALAGVVQNPLNIIGTLSAYGITLYDIGYNWVSAELQWLGLAPLPPLPPLASVGRSAAARTPARSPRTQGAQVPVAVELPAPAPVVPKVICCTPQPQPPAAVEGPGSVVRGGLRGAAKASRGAVARADRAAARATAAVR